MTHNKWQTAELTSTFLEGVRGALPQARLQLELIEHILRVWCPAPRQVLDLGCGDGIVGRFILERFPEARLVFLDFSDPMLEAVGKHLKNGASSKVIKADFSSAAWLDSVRPLGLFDVVVSGFAIHHQPDERKKALYAELFSVLGNRGLFLNLEHVSSGSPKGEELFDKYMIQHLYEFHKTKDPTKSIDSVAGTYYHRPDKQENRLTSLEKQCEWLRSIGFKDVDCYFKVFEFALFGGRKTS